MILSFAQGAAGGGLSSSGMGGGAAISGTPQQGATMPHLLVIVDKWLASIAPLQGMEVFCF